VTRPGRIRVHVRPRLRRVGALLLRNWLAITLGSHVWAWRRLDEREMAHELAHARQWRRHGARFALLYLRAALRAWRSGGHWYRDNAFEREASATDR
jgi:hypothetical protein